jgi:EpsI family protein
MLLGAVAVEWLSRVEARVPRAPLSELPLRIDRWHGIENRPFEPKILRVLGVDDHLNRTYLADAGSVSLYIGYYDTQRTGETIHSPMKCLPGTGWQPLAAGRSAFVVNGPSGAVDMNINRYVVQKDADRYLVFFWYQAHGVVVASEYEAKLRLMADAIRLNRTDGALVRLIVPLVESSDEASADAVAQEFIRALFPLLGRHLPA